MSRRYHPIKPGNCTTRCCFSNDLSLIIRNIKISMRHNHIAVSYGLLITSHKSEKWFFSHVCSPGSSLLLSSFLSFPLAHTLLSLLTFPLSYILSFFLFSFSFPFIFHPPISFRTASKGFPGKGDIILDSPFLHKTGLCNHSASLAWGIPATLLFSLWASYSCWKAWQNFSLNNFCQSHQRELIISLLWAFPI